MSIRLVTVRTTPTRLLASNPDRAVYSIQNFSSQDIYVGYDSNVATSGANTGAKLTANGGLLEDEFHKGEVWAIASSNAQVVVIEVNKTKES